MQQEATKKNKKLIWLIAGLAALLVVAGVVAAMFLLPGNKAPVETGPVGGRPDLYWNVDRMTFTDGGTGVSTREPGDDGLYKVRFAYNGEIVEYTIADKRLVNAIDSMDIVGIVKDENGNVIDAVEPTTIATEVSRDSFVQKVEDGSIRVNSSVAMNGMETLIKFTELTQVYNVTASAEIPGMIDTAQLLDRVLVYANDLGEVTHIFILERQPAGDVYWRIDSKNVDSNGITQREPDENGVYHIAFVHKGERVELKCTDKELVNKIDGMSTRLSDTGLQVNEEGYITGFMETYIALRGKLVGAGYHVTAINGNEVTCTYMFAGKESGKSFTVNLNENTEIYNVCYSTPDDTYGAATELQLEDRVIVYSDLEGNPLVIFVMMRKIDGLIYYNPARQYSNGETTRKPNASGYYVFDLIIDGEQRTVRTKDKKLASVVDSFSSKYGGIVLDGDIITFACGDMYIAGHYKYTLSSTRLVQGVTGVILSFVTAGQDLESTANLVMSPTVGIYDMSGRPGTKLGQKTTVKEGDSVRLLADYQNNITHVFVESAYTGYPVYYSLSRQYDSANDCTKRTADAEGYYSFDMVTGGKQVTVKTKSKDIADFIDRQSPYFCALDVRDGIIRDAGAAISAYEMGYKACNWGYFQRYNGQKSMNCANSSNEGSTRYKLSKDVKIYNVSAAYSSHRGETTTLKEGDRIGCIALGKTQEIVEIYVITRQVESKVYWNINRQYNSTTKETTRTPNSAGYYAIDLAVDGEIIRFRTKDKEIATRVDSQDYAFGLEHNNNTIKTVFAATNIKGISSQIGAKYDVVKISGNKLYLESICPGNTSFGTKRTEVLASGYKAYDVSAYAENPGAKTTLQVGDRVVCYRDADNNVSYVFVMFKNVHNGGAYAYCEHCDQEVYWQPFENKIYTTDAHVYLTHDRNLAGINDMNREVDVEDRPELTVDLNGNTWGVRRSSFVYSTLNIIDSVGGGKIVADVENVGSDKNGNGATLITSKGGTINLYGGTITHNDKSDPAARGGCLIIGGNCTFNMYGGKITGGKADTAANVYIGSNTTVNLLGGEIDGDIAISNKSCNLTIGGVKINKGTQGGLRLPNGLLLDLSKVTKDTKVCIDAAGVFTKEYDNIADYKDNFYSSEASLSVDVMGKALVVGKLLACPHCGGEEVVFGKFTPEACSGNAHLIVTEDIELTKQIQIGTTEYHDDDVVIDLNGKTVELVKTDLSGSTGRFALLYGALSIMDSSEEQTGKIYSNVTDGGNGGMILMGSGAVSLDLYSGSLIAGEDYKASTGGIISVVKNSTFTMHDGLISGGNSSDKNGGNINVSGLATFIMKGGEITGGTSAAQGGNIIASNKATVIIEGGTIEKGSAVKGGNIATTSANVTIGEAATVTGGKGASNNTGAGGNIYLGVYDSNTATYTLTVKGKVTNGRAWNSGNIDVSNALCAVVIDGGTVSGGTAYGYTGGNISTKGAVSIINGGTLKDGNAPETATNCGRGGNIYINTGSLTVGEGATVSGGHGSIGGNIYLDKDGAFLNIQAGAQVLGGTAATKAQSIFVNSKENVLTIAGTVKSVEVPAAEGETEPTITGGDVLIEGTASDVTVSGAAEIEKLTLPEGLTITASGLTTGAKIKVEATGVFTKNFADAAAATAAKGCFESLVDGMGITVAGSALAVGEAEAPEADINDPLNFQADGKTAYCAVCDQDVEWTELAASSSSVALESGHYHFYTANDEGLTNRTFTGLKPAADATVNICLYLTNGTSNYGTVVPSVNGTLNVFGTGTLRLGGSNQIIRGASAAGATVNVYGGEIIGGGSATAPKTTSGTAIYLIGTAEAPATLNVLGGTIRTGYSNKDGGLIYTENAIVNISGGTIKNGTATETNGGNIAMIGGQLNISGGTISGGKAEKAFGGNIFVNGTQVTITGGTIDAGLAKRGGNFLIRNGASLSISGTSAEQKATISNGVSTTHGGNIYVYGASNEAGSTVTVGEFAVITGGDAQHASSGYGGNIALVGNASATSQQILTINGGEITNGHAGKNGGNIGAATTNSKVVMNGGTVSGGTVADRTEGNNYNIIVMTGATMDFLGGTVTDGRLSVDSASSLIRLGGNATITSDYYLYLGTDAKAQIVAGWTGSATVNEGSQADIAAGSVLTNITAGHYVEGVFTPADIDFTGLLTVAGVEGAPSVALTADTTDAAGTLAVKVVEVAG